MNIEEFIAAHGFNPANTQEAQRHATRVQVVDFPASCLAPELAATYIGLSPVNAAFIPPALIGQSAYLQRLIVEIDPLLISLIPAGAVEPSSYLELALRAVTANAQAISRIDPDFMTLHATELVALYPAAVDFIPVYMKAFLPEHLQTHDAPASESNSPVVFLDFALSEISTEVKDHGYDVLIMQIKRGWWPRSCNPMKPKNVADCFRQLKGTPGNFAFLLKAWLGTQSLKDVCQFIETDAQLRLAGDVFDSRVLAEAIAEHGPLLAGLLERDLGL